MRILLADDDARIGKHIRQALIAEGYAVDYAEDGDEALWLAENNTYDAIILDVMMPLRDGFTIARSLLERKCSARRVNHWLLKGLNAALRAPARARNTSVTVN